MYTVVWKIFYGYNEAFTLLCKEIPALLFFVSGGRSREILELEPKNIGDLRGRSKRNLDEHLRIRLKE